MNQSEVIKTLELIRFHLGEIDEAWIDNLCENDEANIIIGTNIKNIYLLLNEWLKDEKIRKRFEPQTNKETLMAKDIKRMSNGKLRIKQSA